MPRDDARRGRPGHEPVGQEQDPLETGRANPRLEPPDGNTPAANLHQGQTPHAEDTAEESADGDDGGKTLEPVDTNDHRTGDIAREKSPPKREHTRQTAHEVMQDRASSRLRTTCPPRADPPRRPETETPTPGSRTEIVEVADEESVEGVAALERRGECRERGGLEHAGREELQIREILDREEDREAPPPGLTFEGPVERGERTRAEKTATAARRDRKDTEHAWPFAPPNGDPSGEECAHEVAGIETNPDPERSRGSPFRVAVFGDPVPGIPEDRRDRGRLVFHAQAKTETTQDHAGRLDEQRIGIGGRGTAGRKFHTEESTHDRRPRRSARDPARQDGRESDDTEPGEGTTRSGTSLLDHGGGRPQRLFG